MSRSIAIVGRGRAGSSFAAALAFCGEKATDARHQTPTEREWEVEEVAGRGEHLTALASHYDVILLCVPDALVADVAAAIEPGHAVVAHVAGSLGLDVLAPHPRRASMHPLATMPNAELGGARLRGANFAVAGDAVVRDLVTALGGTAFTVADADRAAYHAAACIASNHVVALLGQVERVAASTGVPLDAYLDLVAQSVDNVAALGPAEALTGPAARGDQATIDRHRAALDPVELPAYDAMVDLCRRLAGLS